MMTKPQQTVWRITSLAAITALVLIVTLGPAPETRTAGDFARSVLWAIPLLLPVIGIARGHRYTFRWATLCVLPYLIVALTELVANPSAWGWSVAMLALSLLLFAALIGFLRVSED